MRLALCAFALGAAFTFASVGRVDAAVPPTLNVTHITRDRQSVSRVTDVTLRDFSHRVIDAGQPVRVGETLPNEVELQVPARDTVVVASGRSRLTLEPNSVVTFDYTGTASSPGVEVVGLSAGKTDVDDPLDFYRVVSHSVELTHHTTLFSVNASDNKLTITCTEGSVKATLLGVASPAERGVHANAHATAQEIADQVAAEAEYAKRADVVSASGHASISYTLGKETNADIGLANDETAANEGNAYAEYDLGSRYEDGHDGVPQNYVTALHWYRRAATRGLAIAQNAVGRMTLQQLAFELSATGLSLSEIDHDYAAALHSFRLAAAQNLAAAEDNIADMSSPKAVYLLPSGFGNYATSLHWYRLAAAQGDAYAEDSLGNMYAAGLGVRQNFGTALHWYQLAAAHGSMDARTAIKNLTTGGPFAWVRSAHGEAAADNNIGVMYAAGRGVPQSYATALRWFRRVASRGLAAGEFNVGSIYNFGCGVLQDYATALHWYRLAADQDDAAAEDAVGELYDNGEGVTRSYRTALHWYRLAAAHGYAKAEYNIGFMYDNGDGVTENQKIALHWYRLAAAQGETDAENNIGQIYLDGIVVPQSDEIALHWYERAAAKGDAWAKSRVTVVEYLLCLHIGEVNDYVTALHWCEVAAAQGSSSAKRWISLWLMRDLNQQPPRLDATLAQDHTAAAQADPNAEFHMGARYAYGIAVHKDYAVALRWYRLAVAQGLASAEYYVGTMYYDGHGVAQDYATALHWFQLAAAQGDADAEDAIGNMYYYGDGVTQDFAAALHWYELSAAGRNGYAEYHIGVMYWIGHVVPQDDIAASGWFELAAAQSSAYNTLAAYSLERLFYERHTEQDLMLTQYWGEVEVAQRDPYVTKNVAPPKDRTALTQDEAWAEVSLGYIDEHGLGVPQDYAMALHWYQLSAAQGNTFATTAVQRVQQLIHQARPH